MRELDQVRIDGFAYDIEERYVGTCGVAAPVYDQIGDMVASVAVVVPAGRFTPEARGPYGSREGDGGQSIGLLRFLAAHDPGPERPYSEKPLVPNLRPRTLLRPARVQRAPSSLHVRLPRPQMENLLALTNDALRRRWNGLTLGYTESQGLPELRGQVAATYETVTPAEVLIAAPEEAVFLAMNALLEPGDRVVCTYPGYQSLYQLALSLGCEVTYWEPVEAESGVSIPIVSRNFSLRTPSWWSGTFRTTPPARCPHTTSTSG